MHKVKLLSAALLTAATFATPVLAAGHTARHLVTDAHGRVMSTTQRDEGDKHPGAARWRLRDRTVDRCGTLRAQHGLLIRPRYDGTTKQAGLAGSPASPASLLRQAVRLSRRYVATPVRERKAAKT